MGCHRTFSSDTAAERHRVGRHGIDRRCLRPEEYVEPWRLTSRGWSPFAEREIDNAGAA